MSTVLFTCRICKRQIVKDMDIDIPGLLESIAKDPEGICNGCIKPEELDIEIITAIHDRGLRYPSELAWYLGESIDKITERLEYLRESKILFEIT